MLQGTLDDPISVQVITAVVGTVNQGGRFEIHGHLLWCIGLKIMFLDGVIGRRSITIRLPPSILPQNIILRPIEAVAIIRHESSFSRNRNGTWARARQAVSECGSPAYQLASQSNPNV